ncbi:hypothetical protein [Kitasatospora sp. NBC_00458]|uniref:hypothetical protein n=1 Tax=Kitasatospora sp. NBC_00458 TaxID=2903568 RepID=UPI002E177C1A
MIVVTAASGALGRPVVHRLLALRPAVPVVAARRRGAARRDADPADAPPGPARLPEPRVRAGASERRSPDLGRLPGRPAAPPAATVRTLLARATTVRTENRP